MFENRSQQSKTEVNARTERSKNSSQEQTCLKTLLKKPVESQYSSSSRKKTDRTNIIATNFVLEQLKSYNPSIIKNLLTISESSPEKD